MSKTKQRGKQFKEWFGKRPLSHYTVSNNSKINKFFKRLLHKMERVESKKRISQELFDN